MSNRRTFDEWGQPDYSIPGKHVTPYTGHPFHDNCDCCGRWGSLIIHVATNGWRYCDRCTYAYSFGTEGVV